MSLPYRPPIGHPDDMSDRSFPAVEALVRRVQRIAASRPDPARILAETISMAGDHRHYPDVVLGILVEGADSYANSTNPCRVTSRDGCDAASNRWRSVYRRTGWTIDRQRHGIAHLAALSGPRHAHRGIASQSVFPVAGPMPSPCTFHHPAITPPSTTSLRPPVGRLAVRQSHCVVRLDWWNIQLVDPECAASPRHRTRPRRDAWRVAIAGSFHSPLRTPASTNIQSPTAPVYPCAQAVPMVLNFRRKWRRW